MQSIKYFLYLLNYLEVNPLWIIITLVLYSISKLYPYKLKGKFITKKDKEGNEETKYFEYRD